MRGAGRPTTTASRLGAVGLTAFVACASIACGWPDHRYRDDAVLDASSDGTVIGDSSEPGDGTAPEDGGLPKPTQCPPGPTKAGACSELRAFPGTFVADGVGDEFCREVDGGAAMPPRRFSVAEADRTTPSPAPASPETIEVRAGLSAYGVHVFVQVLGDPRVLVDRADPAQGDAIEIFLRGNVDRGLSGAHEDDDAQQLVLSPPGDTAEGVAMRYLHDRPLFPIDDAAWRSRRVEGGWEVELHYPWTSLKNQASPGMIMGFDVALDVKDDPASVGREVRAVMHYQAVASSPSCDAEGSTTAEPWCDDRTWCVVKAYVP